MTPYNRNILLVLLLTALSIGGAQVGWPKTAARTDKERILTELRGLSEAFAAAAKVGDTAKLRSLISADYTGFDPYYAFMITGPQSVAQLQEAWNAYYKPANGDEILIRGEAQPMVQLYGDIAVLTYEEFEGVKTTDQRFKGGRNGKCSFIYRRTGHGWVLVHSHIARQAGQFLPLIGR